MDALRKKLITMLTSELESCESYLREKAHSMNSDYTRVLNATQEELGLMVNETGLTYELAKARLRDESIDTTSWHCQALWDVEFSTSDYKTLGENDGALQMINRVATLLGQKKLAARACAATYNDN
jgi:hypothetical protein